MSDPSDPRPAPDKPCDLVMRGGVTSGLVYPKAVLQLKDKYWFRGIAGSSVGVVAAAATAAAELGRDKGGFEKLDALSQELSESGRLLELFQPTRDTAPAMRLFLLTLDRDSGVGKVWAAARAFGLYWRFGVIVMLVLALFLLGGAGLAVSGSVRGVGFWIGYTVVAVLVAHVVAAAVVPWWLLRRMGKLTQAVRDNGLGVCTGMTADTRRRKKRKPALTAFLHDKFAHLAGLPGGAVLTFGDLRRNARPIELKMITTNLSTQMPVVFPLALQQEFLFRPDEFATLFPAAVVGHLVKHARKDLPAPPAGWHYLPATDDLPVLVPVRISLGHPVLFSGVPLYAVAASYRPGQSLEVSDLQRHFFSDGGIVSNFPIHIFDKWLPSGPTFGINLGDVAEPVAADRVSESALTWQGFGASSVTDPETERVRLGRAGVELPIPWQGITGWWPLAESVFYAAKNHRDNAQAVLPSYRERIVTVLLAAGEGGMNLDMGQDVVAKLMEYGTKAGAKLRDEFDFDAHRWARVRIVLARLEEQLRAIHTSFGPTGGYTPLLAPGGPSDGTLFPLTPDECATAVQFLNGLWEYLDGYFRETASGPLDVNRPPRSPALRFVPADQEGEAPPAVGLPLPGRGR